MKLLLIILLFFTSSATAIATEPVIGGPCQGCEFVFVGMPSELKASAQISPDTEKGEELHFSGTVSSKGGNSIAGVIVYAYQTDNNGVYPKGQTWHGRLRAWAMTDKNGKYSFKTIRPQTYPKRDIPQHIHLHVIEPNKGTYYIDNLTFDDDPLLTQEQRDKLTCRGGCGTSIPKWNESGYWEASRDIILGRNIPDYE